MTFNFEAEVVSIDAGTSSLQAETLQKGARDAEESNTGIVYRRIIDASGKVTLDAQSETGLTVTLLRNWKILSLKTSGLLSVGGGNVVNENTGVLIFASNPQVDTQNNTSVAGVRVTTGGGGGATAQEIADAVLQGEIESGYSLEESMRLQNAILLGKASQAPNGTIFRDIADTKDRVTSITDDDGNRTDITLDET